jgi:hypothetical protein
VATQDGKKSSDEIRVELSAQQEVLISWLNSDDGTRAMDFINRKFGGDVLTNDPYRTHVRIGERNVVDYLRSLREEK